MSKGQRKIISLTKKREELVAKFLEDNRVVSVLTFPKFSLKTENPYRSGFLFVGAEIKKIINFIHSIIDLLFDDNSSIKIDDIKLKDILLSKEQTRKLFRNNEEILIKVNF